MPKGLSKPNRYLIMQFFLMASFVVTFFLLPCPSRPIWLAVIGSIFAIIGLFIFAAALIAHQIVNRSAFVKVSPVPDSQNQIVVRGIYSVVRHPIYLGAILIFLGCAVAFGNWLTLSTVILLAVLIYFKSKYEEQLLQETYPDYKDYITKTGRLFPKLW